MLLQRIITALVLLFAFVAITIFLSAFQFSVLLALLGLIAAWEWAGFIGLTGVSGKLPYLATLAAMELGIFFLLGINPEALSLDELRVSMLLILGLIFWVLSLFMLVGFPDNKSLWNDESKIAVMGIFALLPTWVGLLTLKYLDPTGHYLLALVILVAAVDVGAYFVGVNFGSKKLAPNLSPKKSWEGVWGGLAVCMLVGVGFIWGLHTYVEPLTIFQIGLLLLLMILLCFFSVIGDLVESMLKRNQGIKDSGAILPGHGGMLDRIDGLMAATPAFVLTLMLVLNM
ncbi:MAG: phosphatidate cytidylyltransferase [Gammaproteobacteria bacterium]|nr:phosphatidate cytidylyltransferase [Gammaproteobacteria bacterium]